MSRGLVKVATFFRAPYTSCMSSLKKFSVTIEMAIMSFETDFVGIVNNTEFIRFLERVRYSLSKRLGLSFKQVRSSKLWNVMAHVEINYISPARFEDVMLGTGWVEKVGNTSLTLGYEFRLKGTRRLIAEAKQVLVFVNNHLKPTSIPAQLRKKLLARVISSKP